jgi:MraZ protein
MHDCGHAPFSHTFEEQYDRDNHAEDFLLSQVSEQFKQDYRTNYSVLQGPAPHETFSAAIFLQHYRRAFETYRPGETSGPELVARMITGCTHVIAASIEQQIENCLILLVHGRAVDVDKLDYILRDTWASGINNVSIDVVRLLSALTLVKHGKDDKTKKLVPAFKSSALSVLDSVVESTCPGLLVWKCGRKCGRLLAVFKGTYRYRVDPKGRLPVPAPFRRRLAREGQAQGLVVTLLDECLAAYPPEEWARLESQLLGMPPFSRPVKALARVLASHAVDCEMDVQGRIRLPQLLRKAIGLETEAIVVGVVERFEIWAPDRWARFLRDSERLLDDVSLDVRWPRPHPAPADSDDTRSTGEA